MIGKENNELPTNILAKWRQKLRRKRGANLQVSLPQEICRSRHFANMPDIRWKSLQTFHLTEQRLACVQSFGTVH